MDSGVLQPSPKKSRLWVPDGVDSAFLSALPRHLREEVLEEQWILLRENINFRTACNCSRGSELKKLPVKKCSVRVKKCSVRVRKCSVRVKKCSLRMKNCSVKVNSYSSKVENCSVVVSNFKIKPKNCVVQHTNNQLHQSEEIEKPGQDPGCSNAKSSNKTDSWALLVTNPRTVKQRLSNKDMYEDWSRGHDDNMFEDEGRLWQGQLLEESQDTLDISMILEPGEEVTCGKSPIRPATAHSEAGTPEVLRPGSPSPRRGTSWQQAAFLQRKLRERGRRSGERRGGAGEERGRGSGEEMGKKSHERGEDHKTIFSDLTETVKKATAEVDRENLDLSGAESYFSDD